jgi:uncharacterized protein (TIGR00299 family) protein
MTLGALVDLGLSVKALTRELGKLRVRGFELRSSRASRSGIRGTRLRVEAPADRGYRHFSDFSDIIGGSRLSDSVKARSLELIRRIFSAEARVHGKRIDTVHLHELGSLDTLIDVVGTVVGLELLGVGEVEASPINVGGGTVRTEHGLMPVPAPATALLLKGAPVFSDGSEFERTTPTGACLVTGLARRFGAWPSMTINKVGHGIGSKDPKKGMPNLLRLVMGTRGERISRDVLVLETTIDDMSPELAGYVLDRLLKAGALDVFLTPVQMKKNRPGVNLTVIADPRRRQEMVEILFAETTTLGLRCTSAQREVLERRSVKVATRFGDVSVKLGLSGGNALNAAPEFEDCRRIAAAKGIPLKEVQQAALAAFRQMGRR